MGDWMVRAFAEIETITDSATGVAALRAAMMKDGILDGSEARHLLAIHKSGEALSRDPDWTPFLIEAIVDYFALSREVPIYNADELKPNWARAMHVVADVLLVNHLPDYGQEEGFSSRLRKNGVNEADAALLVDAISANGLVLDATEVKLLSALFSRAVTYPMAFRTFVWQAIQATVKADSRITDDEVTLLRAIIMGPASLEGIAVSKSEAEGLIDLDKQVEDSAKSDLWTTFVAQAIGSFLLYAGGSPSRLDGEERAWLDQMTAQLSPRTSAELKAFIAKSEEV